MPVSVVVGGQFGSEGKGKVALEIARSASAAAVIRIGGPNSGHTGIDSEGTPRMLRQLPASALSQDSLIILPPGNLIDPDILSAEVKELGIGKDRLFIDRKASIILEKHRQKEIEDGLVEEIGSTASGTGAALYERISRNQNHILAQDHPYVKRFTVESTTCILRRILDRGERIVIEGTQGFGLSVWHGPHYPYVTSRDTTAASFVSESGLAPHDVDQVVLVLRAFPIRVGGNSGPLPNEIDWPTLVKEANLPPNFHERTSATNRVRRVARFDPAIVRHAIAANNPTHIVLNHLDYVDPNGITEKSTDFVRKIEDDINKRISYLGFSRDTIIENPSLPQLRRFSDAG